MLDDATKAQLKSYLERATLPIQIVASLDDSTASSELQALLKDVADPSFAASRRLPTRGRGRHPAANPSAGR